jgi:hypothetical protein
MWVLIISTSFFLNISHSSKNSARYCHKRISVFLWSTCYSGQILVKLEFSGRIFQKYSNMKFHENPSSGSRVVPCGQTDGQADTTELIVDFRNFAEAPKNSMFFPYRTFMYFVWISEQTVIIYLYSINRLVFVTETECVYYAVRTESVFCPHSVFICFVWISEQIVIISLYSINWLVFITQTECVYCAVRAESLCIIQVSLSCCLRGKAINRTYSECVAIQRNISYYTLVFPGSPGHSAFRCCSHGGRRLAEGNIRKSGQILAGIPWPSAGWNIAGVHTGDARPASCCVVRAKPGVYSLRPGSDRQPGDGYAAFSGITAQISTTSAGIPECIPSLSLESREISLATSFSAIPSCQLNFWDNSHSCRNFVAS